MKSRKSLAILVVLAALCAGAAIAQSASAQRIYTCGEKLGSIDWSDKHCLNNVGANNGKWGHQIIFGSIWWTITDVETPGSEATKMKSVQSGVTLEIQSTELEGTGTLENTETFAQGTGVITFEGVTVTAPAGKGCKVASGEIVTNELAVTNQGLTNEFKISPATGETIAEFTVEGCSIAALNHAYTMKGSVKGQVAGSVTSFTHAGTTAQNTLTLSGQKVGIAGGITSRSFFTGNAITVT